MAERSETMRWAGGHRAGALVAALALLAIPLPPATATLAGQTLVPAPPVAPDFAAITSPKEAAKLVRKHLLVKIQLVPLALGGTKARVNSSYVTPRAAAAHALLTEMLSVYAERGLINYLDIEPDCKGLSIIPTRLRITASHTKSGERFERVIEIWDCGLCPPLDPLPDPDGPGEVTA